MNAITQPPNEGEDSAGDEINGDAEENEVCASADRRSLRYSSSKIMAEAIRIGVSKVWKCRIPIPHCCGLFSDLPMTVPRTRVYQVWPGKNVFFFRGRMICGPDPRGFILTAISIVLSDWIFCAYISDAPNEHSHLTATLSIILTVMQVITNLVLAGTKDPGVVPRNNKSPLAEVGTSIGTRSRRISIDGIQMKVKYCRICKIFRPPRSCHCSVCDNCVEKFDHHCPWIGQCIGLRNYRYYMMFVFSTLMFFTYIFSFSLWRIRRKMAKTGEGIFRILLGCAPETFALALFSFMAIWFLGGLLVFHVYLMTLNQTARENFKRRYLNSPNPYDKGALRNIREALFTRLPPSSVNFRAIVEPNWDSIIRALMNSSKEMGTENSTMLHSDNNERRRSPKNSFSEKQSM
ncbi:probable protein S-acyltransferase 1 isoform X1 [Typha latifolia]|uniref:probable protein S-acyltransferase 1 isoform X1 n=1 Tax=Typha latifolia TaxID=4733 RepID=UPI003C2D8E43